MQTQALDEWEDDVGSDATDLDQPDETPVRRVVGLCVVAGAVQLYHGNARETFVLINQSIVLVMLY